MAQSEEATALNDTFAGGGELGQLMRSLDWSATALGSVAQWPQSLKTAVRILLTSRQPMFVWWGESLINLYNDAYKSIVGGRHPEALGQPASEVWQEIWDQIRPRAESAMLKNEGTYDEALLLIMERNGYPEETYYTFSYSPVPNDQGGAGGIICANTDDTQRIIGERQLALLRELAASTANVRTFDQACSRSVSCLETDPYDLPFALIYLVEPGRECVNLAGTCGIEPGHVVAPETSWITGDTVWPFAEVIETQRLILVDLLAIEEPLPTGAWQQSPHQAVVVPIAPSGQTGKVGILIVGLNPLRLFDDSYRGFIELVAAQLAASIANAQAYEEERRRAEGLAELDQAKTLFFSNISHEFRTPLTLMLGPLEDMLAHSSSAAQILCDREQVETAHRNSLRLLKLVNTLLDFSRIEAGRVQAVYEPTDLAALTAELASVFRSAIEQAGLRFIVNCSPLPEAAYVDREMWEKIVLNLLSNAFKFTFAGEIEISLQSVEDQIELAVRDTGTGIPAAELSHIFERFHRVQGARGRTYEGSGIGLSLVQELIKLHGGTLQVISVVNQGTCFTVAIPVGSAHLPVEQVGAVCALPSITAGVASYVEEALRWSPTEVQEGVAALTYGPFLPVSTLPQAAPTARILLADDNADMCDYLRRMLSQQYVVETVSNGVVALAAIRHQVPDLVLTDVMMPGLDGFELLRSLRSDPQTIALPVILLSARAGEESRIEGLDAGADDYLIKPFSARELLARIEATLKMARLRQEAAQREQELRDIGEAAQREAALAANRIGQILESMTDAFALLDRDWRILYQNVAAERINGKPREQVIGKTHWEEWPDAIGTNLEHQYRWAMTEQTAVHFEHLYQVPSVGDRWFEIHAYPSAEGLSIFFRDITERKQVERELRQSEERYRYLAESIPQLVWTANSDGELLDVNQRWSAFTGLAISQARDWQKIVHPDDLPTLSQRWNSAQQAGGHYQAEGRIRRTDGVYRWHLHQAVPLKTESGQVIKWLGTATEIEEQKQLAQQRDQSLQQAQAAKEHAERTNRIKDEFLAVLSHELRSPLNPILGWTKLLQTHRFDQAKTAEALQVIERNAKLQAELVEDLLDISRILQGKLSINILPVDLATTIQAAMETVQLAAVAKAIQLQLNLDSKVGYVSGDASRLQQVVWNLVSNAVKFTPTGGRVNIRLEQLDSQAQITVSDTGKGIAPHFLPYVFDSFRQADATITRTFGGLGLGLAIGRHLVELHGGSIEVDSSGEGKGSVFTVRLPLTVTEPRPVNAQPRTKDSPDLAGIRVLLVDDNADARAFMAFLLEEYGASVTAVASAYEALEALVSPNLDILLSDIGMPEMDGYQLIQRIRALPSEAGGQVPAIALTAYAGEIDHQRALAAGFQHHIAKPVEPSELIAAIASLMLRSPE